MRTVASCIALAACTGNATPSPSPQSSGQSFHDGVQALCDTPAHVPDSGEPFDKRLAELARWADRNITNTEARQLGGDLHDLARNREALAAAVAKAGIAHCTLLDNGMELQSFTDAMTVICDAADPSPAYYKSHLLNTEVVRMFAALGDANPADARKILNDAIKRAGRTSCRGLAAASKPTFTAPTVADQGLVELDTADSSLVITKTGIVVEGKPIVAVVDGDVDPGEKEGGALGILIPRLRDFTKALVAAQATRPGASAEPVLAVIADPVTPYRLLLAALFSTKSAGIRRFLLGVNAGAATTKAIPLVLPDAKPARGGLGLVVTLTKDHLQVWSISGQEGSLKKPKLDVPSDRAADVQKTLAEIVARRWKGKQRQAVDREVLVMPAGDVPIQALASLLVAVRTNTDGSELFPELRLGSGFE